MFEKYRIKKYLKVIERETDLHYLINIYSNLPESWKSKREIMEAFYKQNFAILEKLPLEYQLEKIEYAIQGETIFSQEILYKVSREAQKAYMEKHFTTRDLKTVYYYFNIKEILPEIVMEKPWLINVLELNSLPLNTIIQNLNAEQIKKVFLNDEVSVEKKEWLIGKNKELFLLVDSETKVNYFLKNFKTTGESFTKETLLYWSLLTDEEKNIVFPEIYNRLKIECNSKSTLKDLLTILFPTLPSKSQKIVVLENLSLLHKSSREVQLDLINLDPKLIGFLSEDIRNEIINKEFGTLYYFTPDKGLARVSQNVKGKFRFDPSTIDFNDMSNPVFSAKGTLLTIGASGMDYDSYFFINQYGTDQINSFKNTDIETMVRLCKYDINYILPFVAILKPEELESTKAKVKKIFELMYGREQLKKYSDIIEFIFDNYKYDYTTNKNTILDSLKIIFNKEIIMHNDIKMIDEYIKIVAKEEKNPDLFLEIMSNAYGSHVEGILKGRYNLNEHTINSLELFNPVVYETFGEGLVHDLMSYNVTNLSYLVAIIKDKIKLAQFSKLFRLESHIFGDNIETFQRTLNDYPNFEELLLNLNEKELTPEEIESFYKVISNHNYGEITTKEELSNYEEIVKTKLKGNSITITDNDYIKNQICNALFGIPYEEKYDYHKTYYTAWKITNNYNMANVNNHPLLNENEKNMINFLNYLVNENNTINLMNLLNTILSQKNIIGNPDFHSAIIKMKNHTETLFNDNLITVEKMEEELKKDNPLVKKIFFGKIPVYILNGMDFGLLYHNTGGTNNKFIGTDSLNKPAETIHNLEEQYGSSTISTYYIGNYTYLNYEQKDKLNTKLCPSFNSIPQNSLVAMQTHVGGDSSVEHASKLISSSGKTMFDLLKLYERASKKDEKAPEIAFFRRNRNQAEISNLNKGGRVNVSSLSGEICTEDLSDIEEKISIDYNGWWNYINDNNIPIILINTYAYSRLRQNNLEEEQRITL